MLNKVLRLVSFKLFFGTVSVRIEKIPWLVRCEYDLLQGNIHKETETDTETQKYLLTLQKVM